MLFSRLFLEGVSAELHPFLSAIAPLPETIDPEAAAATHQALFGFNVYPNASLFLDRTGLLGGVLSEKTERLYQQNGFAVEDAPDHIGNEIGYLAFLAGAEVDAWEDNRGDIVMEIHARQRTFLQAYLLLWLPPAVLSIMRNGDELYGMAARLLWQTVLDHARGLKVNVQSPMVGEVPDLQNEGTSLKEIARFLAAPVDSGWWLSARELSEIGRNINLPRGFGGRIQTMMNLFRSAAQYDGAGELIAEFSSRAAAWRSAYAELDDSGEFVGVWLERIGQTEAVLGEMQVWLKADPTPP